MLDLIARLEAASGPNRQIDEMLFELVHGRARRRSTFEQYDPSETLPHYTSSIDAGLTLVPEGFPWDVGGPVRKDVYGKDAGKFSANCGSVPDKGFIVYGLATTPALALCIAALKARKALSDQQPVSLADGSAEAVQ